VTDAAGGAGPIPYNLSWPERVRTSAAIAAWAARIAPELALNSARTWMDPQAATARLQGRGQTAKVFAESLADLPGVDLSVPALSLSQKIATTVHRASTISRFRNGKPIQYGPHPGQVLEIWRRADVDPATPAPVLLFVPGGGWIHGRTAAQGQALMGRLAAHGWVCAAVNYRVAPLHPWPAHIEDVKRALAWTRENIGRFGGSTDFVAMAGASAGGHLASLIGLTAASGRWQAGLEDADVHVDAVVSLYGRYDWESRETRERQRFMRFLERVVVGTGQHVDQALYSDASPVAQMSADAPPFFVIHGREDAIIPVAQARQFVECLRESSSSSVLYAELPGAGHAFDVLDPYRAGIMAKAVEKFLNYARTIARQTG